MVKRGDRMSLSAIAKYNARKRSRNLRGARLIRYKQNLTLTSMLKSILVGTLLGDASIRSEKVNLCVKFEQRVDRSDYVEHLAEQFAPFVGTGPRLRVIRNAYHKDYGVSCWFRTYSHPVFTHYGHMFYHYVEGKRIKRVPVGIHKYLDARALAYWFMDDGSYWPNGSLILNTQGFTLSEQKILIKALKRNFDLIADVRRDKTYYRLDFDLNQSTKIAHLIQSYVHPDFFYKLEKLI